MNCLCITAILYCYTTARVYGSVPKVDVDAYCKTKCYRKDEIHTICKYKCELAPECRSYHHIPLSDEERQFVVDLHNKKRNLVASGEDTRGGNDKAKNMLALSYDKDIEVSTYCWSRRCKFGHDICRHTLKYITAGQNLYIYRTNHLPNLQNLMHLNKSIEAWYDEIKDSTKELIQKYYETEEQTGHFTQMIWHSTKFLGCSRVTFDNPVDPQSKFKYWLHIICNYSPAGNFADMPVYEFGSGCVGNSKNTEYPALCGEIIKFPPEENSDPKADVDAYCKVQCPKGDKHTICENKCEVAPECSDFQHTTLSDKERQFMLDLHNYKRNLVASGRDPRGGNSEAKNMAVLNYDKDIEVTTYCWSKRCKFANDVCRHTLKHKTAGQNLFLSKSIHLTDAMNTKFLNQSVTDWYEEISNTTTKLIQNFGKSEREIGRYTQMLWHTTEFIGCSRVTFVNPENPQSQPRYWLHIICNYSPEGNVLGQPVYQFGNECTGDLKPNSDYRALCGDMVTLSPQRDESISQGETWKSKSGGSRELRVHKIENDVILLVFTLASYFLY